MESLMIISLLLASLVLLACWSLVKPKNPKNLPPGPPKLPIIGNIHQLISPTPHRVLRSLARKYGPIMHLELGKRSAVIVSTPRLAAEILKTNDINFADRPTTMCSEIFFYKARDIAMGPYNEYSRQMKRVCTLELLSAKKVRSFSSVREAEVTSARMFLESKAGTPVNMREIVGKLTNNVICKVTMGDCCKDPDTLIKVVSSGVVATANTFNLAWYYPRLNFLNVIFGNKAKWLKMQKQVDDMLQEVLEEHKGKIKDSRDQEDLMDVLLRIQETGDLDIPITTNDVKAIVLDMLTAGTEASSSTLAWAMAELMKNPEQMRRAQAEVRSVVKGSTVTEEDLQSLHYLKMVVKETLRVHMPAPLLLPRECRQDCNVDGYDIPAKTMVLVNAWACGTDPDAWENPDSFIPERFENSSISYNGADLQYIPFSAGRRMCAGVTFGLSMVEYPLANFLYHFDWKLPNGMEPHELDLTEIYDTVTELKHPLHIVPISKPIAK